MHNNNRNENNRKRAKDILEIVHTDVCGPFKTAGLKGEIYFICFIDDYSKICLLYTSRCV